MLLFSWDAQLQATAAAYVVKSTNGASTNCRSTYLILQQRRARPSGGGESGESRFPIEADTNKTRACSAAAVVDVHEIHGHALLRTIGLVIYDRKHCSLYSAPSQKMCASW